MAIVDFHRRFHQSYAGAGAGSSGDLVPAIMQFALGSHAYMIDWEADTPLMPQSVPLLSQQQDIRDVPGEQSLNREGFWRRSGESWHMGAGQEQFDRKDSNEFRFRDSLCIDTWDKWHFKLHKATDAKALSVSTNLKMAVAGGFWYAISGTTLSRTTDITPNTPTFTNITGVPGVAPTHIDSDGFNVITAHGASGLYKTTRGAATTASHITGTVAGVGFVKNRWIAFNAGSIYDVTALTVGAGGALPAALFTHGNTDFAWVGLAEGNAAIYAAGFSGDKSLIYKIDIKPDGTALSAPTVAAALPDGEIVTAIYGYLGRFVLIGTNKGWRLAASLDTGDLNVGELVETPSSVLCFEGQGEFVWYGLSNFTSTETGLGRISLKYFTDLDALVPAYASDLMVHNFTQAVQSIVTFNNIRVFSISGVGFYAEELTTLEPEGHLDTGEINFGMTEHKIGITIDNQHQGDMGMHEIAISFDGVEGGGPFVSLGAHEHDSPPRSLGNTMAEFFEIRHTLHRDTIDITQGLAVHNWLLQVQPTSQSVTTTWVATVLIAPEVETLTDYSQSYNVLDEIDYIKGLAKSKEVVPMMIDGRRFPVIVEDYAADIKWMDTGDEGYKGPNASVVIKMKETV